MTVQFNDTPKERELIVEIAKRAEAAGWTGDRLTTIMDLSACHSNGCPLDLERLLEADDFNVLHDVSGINRHMDRETGKLTGHFMPRFAARRTVGA